MFYSECSIFSRFSSKIQNKSSQNCYICIYLKFKAMNLRSNIIVNLLILAVSILLIVFCNGNVLSTLIIIIGIAFIIPCLANIIMILTRKEKDKEGNNINRSKASFAYGVIASLGRYRTGDMDGDKPGIANGHSCISICRNTCDCRDVQYNNVGFWSSSYEIPVVDVYTPLTHDNCRHHNIMYRH